MKTMIQLAFVSIMVLTSCEKDELQEIEPSNASTSEPSQPGKVTKNDANPDTENWDPSNPDKIHY